MPVAFAAATLLVVAGYASYWDLRSPAGLAVFGALLVALSLFASLTLDRFTQGRRRRDGRRRLLNRPGPRSRLFKLVLGGVLIPVALLVAANEVELPGHRTPMAIASTAVRSSLGGPPVTRASRLGDAVLHARSAPARTQGILALRAMDSGAALDQLLRLLRDDPALPEDEASCQALAAALASYGATASTRLVQLLDAVPSEARRSATGPPGDSFERDVLRSLKHEELPRELERQPAAPQPMPTPPPASQGRDSLPSLMMQSLLQMDDSGLLGFARRTAGDERWSGTIRGQALLLVAKLGGKDDLDGLYPYIESKDPILQAYALRALATLAARLKSDAAKG